LVPPPSNIESNKATTPSIKNATAITFTITIKTGKIAVFIAFKIIFLASLLAFFLATSFALFKASFSCL
jgi:hypothetical protein